MGRFLHTAVIFSGILFYSASISAQGDVTVNSSVFPSSGCNLSATENVTVIIEETAGVAVPGGAITVYYQIDANPPVSEVLGPILGAGATSVFTFSVTADLSECGRDFEFTAWVDYAPDLNQTNDTLRWTVTNDCTIIPGNILSDMTVCDAGNRDTLRLDGWQNGQIIDWEYSEDGGGMWNSIGTTDTFHIFNNITTTTIYRVQIDGGFCPDDTSPIVTVTLQPAPVGGTIDGSISVCAASHSGMLELIGSSGPIIEWQYSDDAGSTWNPIANTTTTENYNLTDITLYRVLVSGGGVCLDVYSDTAIVHIATNSEAGTLLDDVTICVNDSTDLGLTGVMGNVQRWQSSPDGTTWTNILTNAIIYNTGPLTEDTHYRAIVSNGACAADTSNSVLVSVTPLPVVSAGSDVIVVVGEQAQLDGGGGISGVWTPDTLLSNPNVFNPVLNPTDTGQIVYTYTVTDANSCSNSAQVTVYILSALPSDFSIKNVVTPNLDGYNDTWIIEGITAYPSTSVYVYNIYGYEVYSSGDYQNDWDATFKDKKLPNGTYFYVVTPGGTDSKLKGTLNIIGNE